MARSATDKLIWFIHGVRKAVLHGGSDLKRLDPMTFLKCETLRLINDEGDMAMKEISDYYHITPPSATSLVEGLVKSKYLTRVKDKKDGRIVKLKITAAGQKAYEEGIKILNERIRKIFSKLSKNEINALMKILDKIQKSFNNN